MPLHCLTPCLRYSACSLILCAPVIVGADASVNSPNCCTSIFLKVSQEKLVKDQGDVASIAVETHPYKITQTSNLGTLI